MKRLLLFALLIYTVSAESCIIQDKKGKQPDIRVIELVDDSSNESSESEIVSLNLPDRRRRESIEINNQEASQFCRSDDDCGPGLVCLAYLACVKARWRTVDSVKATATN